MSQLKCKLVLKAVRLTGGTADGFSIVKSVNTLEFGVPGDELTRDDVDKILKIHNQRIRRNELTVEFIK